MPGLNGTGPMGQGAMTGRGAGNCSGNTGASGFYGRGMGFRGNWAGRGRGMGRWQGMGNFAGATSFLPTGAWGLDALKSQAKYLEDALGNVKKQIDALSADKDKE